MSSSRSDANESSIAAIEVISDVVCPWCFIGKRRLEQAISHLGAEQRPRVIWLPFELNPNLPAPGIERRAYLAAKFGSPERASQIYQRVQVQGRTVGIEFEFERIQRQPNTFDAHRLIGWAQAKRDASALVERLFEAFFLQGRDVGERNVLADVAGETGFDAAAARRWLDTDEGRTEVQQQEQRARALGIDGVPFFVFNQQVAVSGAQQASVLRDALEQSGALGQSGSGN